MEKAVIEARDKGGYTVLDAIAWAKAPPGGSLANPHMFGCMDGASYWIKRAAQHGLAAELIAGRLGSQIGASADAKIVRVPREALPADGSANHLEGVGVGLRDQDG